MVLPKFLQPCLPSYDLSKLSLKRDKKLIITQVLNRGDDTALEWLGKTCTQKDIKEVVSSPTRGMWMKPILSYWQKIFGLKINKKILKKAIINLNAI